MIWAISDDFILTYRDSVTHMDEVVVWFMLVIDRGVQCITEWLIWSRHAKVTSVECIIGGHLWFSGNDVSRLVVKSKYKKDRCCGEMRAYPKIIHAISNWELRDTTWKSLYDHFNKDKRRKIENETKNTIVGFSPLFHFMFPKPICPPIYEVRCSYK